MKILYLLFIVMSGLVVVVLCLAVSNCTAVEEAQQQQPHQQQPHQQQPHQQQPHQQHHHQYLDISELREQMEPRSDEQYTVGMECYLRNVLKMFLLILWWYRVFRNSCFIVNSKVNQTWKYF